MISTFAFPTKIIFGPNAVDQTGDVVKSLARKRPLIVTDTGVAAAGLVTRVTAVLKAAGLSCAIFDKVEANPTEASVLPGVEAYSKNACDCIIGLGGGSPLDAAKAIRLKTTHQLPLEEYDDLRDGSNSISQHMPPMIGIATTSGTGSEVSRSTVITLKSTGRKTVIFSPCLIPTVAIDDPSLTLGLSPHLTAATGMDAITHNLEAYLSVGYHPMCDAIAMKGVSLAAQYLPFAVKDGLNMEARSQMMMASVMGAVAFQKGLGTVHSLAHPLSTVAGMHHGLSNAILLPHVMRFNLPAVAERLADVAAALGVDTRGMETAQAAEAAITAVENLNRTIGLPGRLTEAGVREEMIPSMAPMAMEDGCRLLNPRPTTLQDMEMLYRQAL
jgi:4-hydroxybutyrate dehydrogenase